MKPFKNYRLLIPVILLALVVGLFQSALQVARGASLTWWLVGSTVKVPSLEAPPTDPKQPLHLHAARQEYAPFQIVFQTDDSLGVTATLALTYPGDHFDVKVYREQYFPLNRASPSLGMFSLARLREKTLPDGLAPIKDKFPVPGDGVAVVWVDVFVHADTPPGDYTITLASGNDTRTVQITVYPVNLAPSAAMNVIVPLEPNWSIPFFAQGNPDDFHRNVNEMLVKHDLVPGTPVAQPRWTGQGWDFSPLDAELSMLPPGSSFFAPLPYDAWNKEYLLRDPMGRPYYRTNFDDPYFVAQVKRYFQALAQYLRSKGRLKTALIYPTDESRWVGDEPIHNGPQGFARLSRWTQFAHAAGLRVIASGVTPVAQGLPSLGWPESVQVTDDSHVPLDYLDADPGLFAEWMSQPGHSASIYLNEYGDLIDVPASLQRGLIWHAYARGVRIIAGYAAMQWVDAKWNLVDPWKSPDSVFPQVGYGVGAILWPGPGPSLRLKVLREGVEDARLLDLYAKASSADQAVAIAVCLTPGPLADQTPPADLWDRAHTALLAALSNSQPVNLEGLCLRPAAEQDGYRIIDMDSAGAAPDQWKVTGGKISMVPSPFANSGNALSVEFNDENNQIGFFPALRDWSGWKYLDIDVQSQTRYFTELNVSLTDAKGNYLMLRNGVALVGPAQTTTLRLPLAMTLGFKGNFDFTHVGLITLQANTVTQQTDGFGQRHVYPLGPRALIFDNFTLAR